MDESTKAILLLARELRENRAQNKFQFDWLRSQLNLVTKTDLDKAKEEILMRLSEVKAVVLKAAADNREAFQELSTKVADMQTRIDELIAGASDPEITDEAFAADLQSLKEVAQSLAAIVPPVA